MNNFESLKQFKIEIKSKPWLFFFVIFLIYNLLKKRWKSICDEVYLTKTKLENHNLLLKESPENLIFKVYGNENNDYKNIIVKRATIENNETYVDTVRKRLKKGNRLIAIIDSINGNTISFLFISIDKIFLHPVHKKLKLDKNSIGVYDVYTYPEYRQRGFYEIILSLTFKYFFEKNYKNMYLWVMKENQISVKTHSKLLINNVIGVFSERYRFGFRILKSKIVSFQLNSLIND